LSITVIKSEKPPRTFGLSIAILASVMLLTILPLLQIGLLLAIQYRFASTNLPVEDGGTPLATGSSFEGIADSSVLIQVVLGLAYLPLAVMAWIGRPRSIRLIIMFGVIALTVITALLAVATLANPPSVQGGIDSSGDLQRTLLISRTVFSALITLYVVWYMNRGPARAFYRGHYMPAPQQKP
jgi:hypothetical protein